MGLATIDPHSKNEHTAINKTPKFSVNQASFDIQRFKNVKINKEMYHNPDAVSSGWPYISTLILTFLNRCISVTTSQINTK